MWHVVAENDWIATLGEASPELLRADGKRAPQQRMAMLIDDRQASQALVHVTSSSPIVRQYL
jgi:hypothetical protein